MQDTRNTKFQKSLTSDRLALNQPTQKDLDALYRIYGDARTNTFNPSGPLRSIADAESTIERWLRDWNTHGFGPWAIRLIDGSDHIVGFGGLTYAIFDAEKKVNLGYRFAVDAWGQGFATEFARAAVNTGFQTLDIDEMFAKVRPEHHASRHVLEKVGFDELGLLDDVPGAASSVVYRIKRPSK